MIKSSSIEHERRSAAPSDITRETVSDVLTKAYNRRHEEELKSPDGTATSIYRSRDDLAL